MRVLVVGGGIAGICAGLALAERGHAVRILDRDDPAGLASRWNAGVLPTSSLVPLATPALLRALPGLLRGASPSFRLGRGLPPATLDWALRFLWSARPAAVARTAGALAGLIALSLAEHRRLAPEGMLVDRGWLHLYSGAGAPDWQTALYREHGVDFEDLDPQGLSALEPDLVPRFRTARWFRGSASVREPRALALAYLARFHAFGGTIERAGVDALVPGGVVVDGATRHADAVVLAAGPFSAALLRTAGLRLPMMGERGYVRRFRLQGGAELRRPVYDVAGGYVLSPRPEGVQMSTGSELTRPGLPPRDAQREAATRIAAQTLPLGDAVAGFEADAMRPTLPDSRPAIGPVRRRPGLWLCTGHQHVGFCTAPGSAALLAALIDGRAPPIDPAPFSPARLGL